MEDYLIIIAVGGSITYLLLGLYDIAEILWNKYHNV